MLGRIEPYKGDTRLALRHEHRGTLFSQFVGGFSTPRTKGLAKGKYNTPDGSRIRSSIT